MAKQLTEHDALGAHAEAELGIDPDDITSPWNAALASMVVLHARRAAAAAHDHAVRPDPADLGHRRRRSTVALALTGWASARFGYGAVAAGRSLRNVLGGLFAMAVTYAIGSALGTHDR